MDNFKIDGMEYEVSAAMYGLIKLIMQKLEEKAVVTDQQVYGRIQMCVLSIWRIVCQYILYILLCSVGLVTTFCKC